MIRRLPFLTLIALAACLAFNAPSSRSVFKSGDSGTLNLVEFSAKGVTFGRCAFRHQGDDVTVIYEARGDEIVARTTNPTVVDPAGKARSCRELAGINPQSVQLRADLPAEVSPERDLDVLARLRDFESKISDNQEYLQNLNSKFFLLSSIFGSSSSNQFVATFGTPNFTLTNLFETTLGLNKNIFG